MTRIAFGFIAFAVLALVAAMPAQAIKYVKGKHGTITCTYDDCNQHCQKTGGKVSSCPAFCTKTINERKASGECK